MKTLNWLVVLFLGLNLLSCTSHSENGRKIVKISIVNTTTNHSIKRDTEITDAGSLERFEKEYDDMKPVSGVEVKNNFGAFEVVMFYNDKKKESIGVVYTVYHGVVILNETNGSMYKNDDMANLMIGFLEH